MRSIAHIAEIDPCIITQMQNWTKVAHFLNTNPDHAYKATLHYLNESKAYTSLKHQSKQEVILSYWIDPSLIEPIITTNTSQMKTKKKRMCSSPFTNPLPSFLLYELHTSRHSLQSIIKMILVMKSVHERDDLPFIKTFETHKCLGRLQRISRITFFFIHQLINHNDPIQSLLIP